MAISAVLKASLIAQKTQFELIGSGGVTKKDKSPVTGMSIVSQVGASFGRREIVWLGAKKLTSML